jgi:hypothetical protein
MTKLPETVFILDTKKEHIGVTEANKLASRSSQWSTRTVIPTSSST